MGRSSEAQYLSLLRNIPDVVWSVDSHCRFTFISPNVTRVTGFTPEDHYRNAGQLVWERMHPDDRARVDGALREFLGGKRAYDVEYRTQRKDGQWAWIRSRSIFRYEFGGDIYADGLASDITDQKRAEEELRAVDAVAQIIASNLDIGQVYQQFSDEVKKLVEFDCARISVIDPGANSLKIAHESGRAGSFPVGGSVPFEGTYSEQVMRTRRSLILDDLEDDTQFWTSRLLLGDGFRCVITVPLLSKDVVIGTLVLLDRRPGAYGRREQVILERLAAQIATGVENSQLFQQRERAQEELKLRNRELLALLNIARTLSQSGELRKKCADVMRQLAEVVEADEAHLRVPDQTGEHLLLAHETCNGSWCPSESLPVHESMSGTAFQRGEPICADDYARHPMAVPGAVARGLNSVVVLPIKADDRTLGVVTVTSRNLGHFTSLRLRLLLSIAGGLGVMLENARLHDEAVVKDELERRTSRFISTASHQLRTPMTSIIGFAELLLNRELPGPTRQKYLERLYHNSQRLAAILNDLLDVSRQQSGNLVANPELLALREIVEDQLADIVATPEKHEFRLDIQPNLPLVLADREKLSQVLANLLDNAIKYSPGGGAVTISAAHEQTRNRVVVAIQDHGVGIAAENMALLFTAFNRIKQPQTDEIVGTGLGLYIAKGLMDLMGGEIWVESRVNRGATFYFSLPTGSAGKNQLA
jgi:PAS domain S-box-containing protein